MSLGLSETDAQVYVFLALNGPHKAIDITKKMNLYTLSLLQKHVFLKYVEIHKNQEITIEILKDQVTEGANFILQDIFGKVKFFVSESLEDLKYLADLAYFIIIGPDFKEFFDVQFISKTESEDGIPKLVTKIKKCVCCVSIKDELQQEEIEDLNYIDMLFSALTALLQMILDYVSGDYLVESKETKCYLKGDPIGEVITYIKPKK